KPAIIHLPCQGEAFLTHGDRALKFKSRRGEMGYAGECKGHHPPIDGGPCQRETLLKEGIAGLEIPLGVSQNALPRQPAGAEAAGFGALSSSEQRRQPLTA